MPPAFVGLPALCRYVHLFQLDPSVGPVAERVVLRCQIYSLAEFGFQLVDFLLQFLVVRRINVLILSAPDVHPGLHPSVLA